LIGFVKGLTRTKEQIVSRFEEIVQKADTAEQRTRPVDVDTIEALEELLISADVGIPATERIVNAVRGRARRGESLRDLVKEEIRKVFDTVEPPPT
jgi:fused signal recognition particle receptor